MFINQFKSRFRFTRDLYAGENHAILLDQRIRERMRETGHDQGVNQGAARAQGGAFGDGITGAWRMFQAARAFAPIRDAMIDAHYAGR
jgi:hypothetical protein